MSMAREGSVPRAGGGDGPCQHVSRWLQRALILATCLAVLSALGVPRAAAEAPGSVSAGKTPLPAECQDLLVIGARGSGQPYNVADDGDTGMGREVFIAYGAMVDELPDGSQASGYGVTYTAFALDGNLESAENVVSGRYFSGLEDGVNWVQSVLQSRSKKCDATERIVLAGFSQGAAVMHRVLQRGLPGSMAGRVDGVLLLGDADRRAWDRVVQYGGAPASSMGLAAWVPNYSIRSKASRARVCGKKNQVPCDRVHSVCLKGDPVCDFVDMGNPVDFSAKAHLPVGLTSLLAKKSIHMQYPESDIVQEVASEIGAQVRESLESVDELFEACLDANADRFDFEDDLFDFCQGQVFGPVA